ncbi:NUDIX hydrolase [Anaerobranca gottschalkii]|uniref:8-oxo-dGTP pyrophosphatase MutT, NUDIX family n=1 Tax=Anaerobranca gottschalkii DSM 13577 TaxID=1120990 RepID=A0A1I0AZU6_9FIRM|nr:CoA pyrophosphatase [Anaerobranca gottschalkii]SES99912.1 8-oxo-dGTP pyrophosphatase MutT, NUDIX family [Anaerobranca gottschalkii DSM 13577]
MDLENITKKLKDYQGKPLGKYNNFAVLLPLIPTKDGLKILFEVRSYNLTIQPGEVCLPGGKVEKGETFLQAALRETCEELNISRDNIKVIGELDYLVTPYDLIIYPYVGYLENIQLEEIKYNEDEVDHLFFMDLDYLLATDPEIHIVDLRAKPKKDFPYHLIREGEDYRWRVGKNPVPFFIYKDYIIWGFTARILQNFKEIISKKL